MSFDVSGFSTEQMISISGASLIGKNDSAKRKNFCVDSREAFPESVFIPLKGEKTDGHLYFEDVLKNGCKVVFCASRFFAKNSNEIISYSETYQAAFLIVPDPLKALHLLAKAFLDSRKPEVRIGLTGSSGKTTTKEIIASMLRECGTSFMTEGNKNSEIGLPLSIFKMTDKPKYAIFEMGMDHKGEMDALAEIVRPDIALITNIGTAHLQKLGSVREIASQKSRIFSRFSGTQTALVNEEEVWKEFLGKKIRGRLFLYGLQNTPKIESVQSLGIDGWKIKWNGIEFDFPLPGDHNLKNLCASLTLCGLLNLDPQSAVRGLSKVSLPPGRLQIHRGKFLLIEDCYNANPDSMKMGLGFFASLLIEGKKIAVLGDMKELGKISRAEHKTVGKNASECGLDQVFFFGEYMKQAYDSFCKNKKAQGTAEYINDYEELRKKVNAAVREGDALYLKASRSMKLERLTVDILGKEFAGGAA